MPFGTPGRQPCGAILRYSSDGIQLQVSDSGQGFDVGMACRNNGLGLENIRERAAAAGGIVQIHSQAGRGTHIEVKVPYEPAQRQRLKASVPSASSAWTTTASSARACRC